jgi:hypothetical protein
MPRLAEEQDLVDGLSLAAYAMSQLGDFEDTPFTAKDDVVLLSFGWKYGLTAATMWYTERDGTEWSVHLNHNYPLFYKNNEKIGVMMYDDVVNTFSPANRPRHTAEVTL